MQTGFDKKKEMDEEVWPVEYKVLVRVDIVADRSAGGMYLPESAQEKQQHAMDTGEIVRMAGNAFADDAVFAEKPKAGDRVMFDKYAGSILHERNGRERTVYRLLNDKDVCAILKPRKQEIQQ